MPPIWSFQDRTFDLDRPIIMGILNVTPDSFADGGKHAGVEGAVTHAMNMLTQGAAIIDVGPASTRPGAGSVSDAEQLRRSLPVIERLCRASPGVVVSIDTTSAAVAHASLAAGAAIVNDVSAGEADPEMFATVAKHRAGLVLMHRVSPPSHDRYSDQYTTPAMPGDTEDVVAQVHKYLRERTEAAARAAVPTSRIALDPGLGFGKTVEQNMALIAATPTLAAHGFPIVSGLSRKSFVGRVALGRDSTPGERLPGTLALSAIHTMLGARIFRVHDVAEHAQALPAAHAAWSALRREKRTPPPSIQGMD